jgi:exodeoxyribonuclease-1
MSEQITFLFMDYETFNRNPKGGRASQFASLRTNYNLEIIASSALNIFCEQTIDNIPSPQAALITKITPQKIERIKNGIEKIPESSFPVKPEVYNEYWFARRINEEMMAPGSCTLGYNSFKFDDEFTRNLLFRNLLDPYAREWRNNNSRFDVYYLVIATYVLKPHLLNFPNAIDKESKLPLFHSKTKLPLPSFRLEELSVENDIHHINAHDAFSDVEATIGIMKKIKEGDEIFFEDMFALRKKGNVSTWLFHNSSKPFIHISQYYGKENYSKGVLCQLLSKNDETLCLNLEYDLEPLFLLEGSELENYLFPKDSNSSSKSVVKIRHNQCPLFASLSEYEDRLINFNIDLNKIIINLNLVLENKSTLSKKLDFFYFKKFTINSKDVDSDLTIYDGFFDPIEDLQRGFIHKRILSNQLENFKFPKHTPRIEEMFFKIKARNFSNTLNEEEYIRWKTYAKERVSNRSCGAELILDDFYKEISELYQQNLSSDDKAVIQEIEDYVNDLQEKISTVKQEKSTSAIEGFKSPEIQINKEKKEKPNTVIELSESPIKKIKKEKEVQSDLFVLDKGQQDLPKNILKINGTHLSCTVIEFNEKEALYLENIMETELISFNEIFFERKAYKKIGYRNIEDLPKIIEITGFESCPNSDSNDSIGLFTFLKDNKKVFISDIEKLETKYHTGLFDDFCNVNSIIRGEDVKFRRKSKSKYFFLKKIEKGIFSFSVNDTFQLNDLLFRHCVYHFKGYHYPLQLLEMENKCEKIVFTPEKKSNVEMYISAI